jgi:hypothetical protein
MVLAGFVALLSSAVAAAPVGDDVPNTGATVAVQRVHLPDAGVRDEAAMVLIGTALIGLAAAVRRVA